jgi:hypothetical protein
VPQEAVSRPLGEATQTGHFDEKFRIVRADGEVRWVTVHGFPARDDAGRIYRLVGTAQDITALKEAEEKIAKHLAAAESARAESDALCKATLALTAGLRMDFVLDTLLESLLVNELKITEIDRTKPGALASVS